MNCQGGGGDGLTDPEDQLTPISPTINITSSRFTQLGIVMMRKCSESRMSKFTSAPTTTTLSVCDSLIVVITVNVLASHLYQCLLNGWMTLFFTKSGEFEH